MQAWEFKQVIKELADEILDENKKDAPEWMTFWAKGIWAGALSNLNDDDGDFADHFKSMKQSVSRIADGLERLCNIMEAAQRSG